ncbi:hypothetical protein EV363DRAFT_1402921 [Boletus edulis]|nr:hypothetical protein EV363DRAFT_1402921 [Boletus edulis]
MRLIKRVVYSTRVGPSKHIIPPLLVYLPILGFGKFPTPPTTKGHVDAVLEFRKECGHGQHAFGAHQRVEDVDGQSRRCGVPSHVYREGDPTKRWTRPEELYQPVEALITKCSWCGHVDLRAFLIEKEIILAIAMRNTPHGKRLIRCEALDGPASIACPNTGQKGGKLLLGRAPSQRRHARQMREGIHVQAQATHANEKPLDTWRVIGE